MKGTYQVVVYRRTGLAMQTFNLDKLSDAMRTIETHKTNRKLGDVYRITLSVCLEEIKV